MKLTAIFFCMLVICSLSVFTNTKTVKKSQTTTSTKAPITTSISSVFFPNRVLRADGSGCNVQFGAGDWEIWNFIANSNGSFCIQNQAHGKYLSLNGNGCLFPRGEGCGSVTVQPWCDTWERLSIISLPDNNFAIKSNVFPNAYLRIDGGNINAFNGSGGGHVNLQYYHNGSTPGGYEIFKITGLVNTHNATVNTSINSIFFPNRTLRTNGGGCNVQWGVGAWEQWDFIPNQDGTYCIKNPAHGKFLSLNGNGCTVATGPGCGSVTVQPWCDAWERLSLIPLKNGSFGIKSNTFPNTFLRIDGGNVHGFMGNGGGHVNLQYYSPGTLPGGYEVFNINGIKSPFKEAETNRGKCTNNGGFGFAGRCLNDLMTIKNAKDNTVDTAIASEWNSAVLPLLQRIGVAPDACIGDFDGSFLKSTTTPAGYSMSNFMCDKLPFNPDYKYGILSLYANNITCPDPVKLQACFTFDKCGTFGMVINGGVAQCMITATGVGAIFSELAKFLDSAAFAFSPFSRIRRTFKVAYLDNDSMLDQEVSVNGQIYYSLGVDLPTNFSIGGKNLKDLVAISGTRSTIIDFGNQVHTISTIISQIRQGSKGSMGAILNSITSSGAEFNFNLNGSLKIKLDSITNNFLPELSFEVGNVDLLFTAGGGTSGRATGFYAYFSSDIIGGIYNLITNFINNQFGGILGAIGFSFPTIPNIGLNVGLAIQTDGLGFLISFPGFSASCYFKYSVKRGSCNFNSTIITALLEAGKWVIRKAKELFDAAGPVIVSFANDVGKFAINAGNEIKKLFSTSSWNAASGWVSKAGNTVGNGIVSGANTVGNGIVSGANTVGNAFVSAFSSWAELKSRKLALKKMISKRRINNINNKQV